jgi:hypothetical protein
VAVVVAIAVAMIGMALAVKQPPGLAAILTAIQSGAVNLGAVSRHSV